MTEETTTAQTIEATAAALGLTMRAEFVPFSKSRNKGEKTPSLNWLVTIAKGGRDIITTDYGAGCGHCPAYKASVKEMGSKDCIMRKDAIRRECETGFKAGAHASGSIFDTQQGIAPPRFADVLSSLAMDSDAIDCPFEEWAGNFGYDSDSRKAEAIYRACLDIAIKLRQAIGDAGLAKLREASQNY